VVQTLSSDAAQASSLRTHQFYHSGPIFYPAPEGELKQLRTFGPTRRRIYHPLLLRSRA